MDKDSCQTGKKKATWRNMQAKIVGTKREECLVFMN